MARADSSESCGPWWTPCHTLRLKESCHVIVIHFGRDPMEASGGGAARQRRAFRTLVRDFHVGVVLLGPDAKGSIRESGGRRNVWHYQRGCAGEEFCATGLDLDTRRRNRNPFFNAARAAVAEDGQMVKNEVIGWRHRDRAKFSGRWETLCLSSRRMVPFRPRSTHS